MHSKFQDMKNKTQILKHSLVVVLLTIFAFAPGSKGWGQTLLLNENFDYVVGTELTANGWTITGSTASPTVTVSAASISLAGYLSSGIGNEVSMAVSGQDVNKTFTPQTAGTVYASCLVNITSATLAGDYFFHLGASTIVSSFHGRVFVKKDASGALAFGISRAGAVGTAVFTPFSYAIGTTYLLVLRYAMVAGATNDVASIYLSPPFNAVEPVTGWTTSTDAPIDLTNIGSVALRQGGASSGPALKIDGIRVATTWADIVGPAGGPVMTVTPNTLTNFTYFTGNGPSSEKTFTISGATLTNDIYITPSTDYEISTGTGPLFVATSPIYLTPTTGTVQPTTIYVRLKSGLPVGAYNNENIVAASIGATSQNVTCSGFVAMNYYSASSGSLDLVTSWGTNTDGTGTNPLNFTADYQVFNIRNNAAPTIGANWTVSGTGAKVIVGDGTNAVNLTIPSAYSFTGPMDVSANATITLQNSIIPVFGTINAASTVIYDGTTNQNINPATYGNLTLSSAGTKTFASNITTVSGNLTIDNTTLNASSGPLFTTINLGGNLTYQGIVTPPVDANSITLITTGTGTQTITTNGNTARWFRLQTTSSGNNVVLSENGIPGILTVGNVSGGGITLATGSQLTLNGNTLYFFNGNVTVQGTGTITCNGSSNIIINRTGTTGTSFGTLLLTSGSNMVNDLTLNLSGIGNNVTLGADVKIVLSLTLTSGILNLGAGTLSYTPFAMLVYNNPSIATTSDIEFPATFGPGMVIVQNAAPTGISLHANRTIEGGLTISLAQKFIVPSGVQLTVNYDLENYAGTSGLVIKSGGSLIHHATYGVDATVERFVSAWVDDAHGWHHLSSPVALQLIRPEFVPNDPIGIAQDFYAWSEVNGYWFNSKDVGGSWVSTFDTRFIRGKGYLVAYQNDATKIFTGTLNSSDVSITGLTNTPSAYPPGDITPGWNLLGNPFASAITWGTTDWALSPSINTTAKIWNETTAAYIDITANTGIIPAMNGFMVETSSNNGTLTIPASARTHNATPWYKSTGNPYIKLVASNIGAQTAQESVVTFDNLTAPGFDPNFDSHFLPGFAPSFYSVDGIEKLSTNVLPGLDNQTTIPFNFIKTAGSDFSIEAVQIDNIQAQVYLTDLKLNKVQNLKENPLYAFTAADGDDPARFLLSFSHVGIDENTPGHNGIYAYENTLYIVNPGIARLEVYNLTGQKLLGEEINNPGLHKTTFHGPTGYYVVRLTTETKVVVTKVFIKS